MINFKILKQSTKSRARIGVLKTSHGEVETPCLVPVATQAVVKTLTGNEAIETGSQILIANTYHLHLQPGEHIIKRAGGLHTFMHWNRPLMTDSGGFQVFSLGFGKDLGMNKMTRSVPLSKVEGSLRRNVGATHVRGMLTPLAQHDNVIKGQQPKLLKITDEGVEFRSHRDGTKLFIGPKESMKIQGALGADIAFAFDECPPPVASRAYVVQSLERTHRWAKLSLRYRSEKQSL